jgi:hypothetical protein
MKIEDYLKYLSSESIGGGASISCGNAFGMDSFELPKKKKIIRRGIYPKRLTEEKGELETGMQRAMIDFDGTIHKYSKGYQDGSLYDEPFDGAKEFIDWLKSEGYQIVIFTTRASKTNDQETGGNHKKEILKIENYLKEHNIHYDLITAEKLAANFYIDDRAIHFVNWKSVKDEVKKRMNL